MHTCDISLFLRLIFDKIAQPKADWNPSLFYISPYLEFQVSLSKMHKFLLCLIILSILLSHNLPFLMYHMYDNV